MTADDWIREWQYWLGMPTLSLFEAVALSMNVEPRRLQLPAHGLAFVGIPPEGFHDRLALAERHIGETLPAAAPRDGEQHVRPGQFVAWASGLGWSMPSELLAVAAERPAAAPTSGKPAVARPKNASPLETVVLKLIDELGWPGKQIHRQQFCDAVRARCGVKAGHRGYGDKTIERIVKKIADTRNR